MIKANISSIKVLNAYKLKKSMLQLAVKKGSHQSYKAASFLCFSAGTQTSSIFITALKGYAAKLINANFKMHSFNEDHTV